MCLIKSVNYAAWEWESPSINHHAQKSICQWPWQCPSNMVSITTVLCFLVLSLTEETIAWCEIVYVWPQPRWAKLCPTILLHVCTTTSRSPQDMAVVFWPLGLLSCKFLHVICIGFTPMAHGMHLATANKNYLSICHWPYKYTILLPYNTTWTGKLAYPN